MFHFLQRRNSNLTAKGSGGPRSAELLLLSRFEACMGVRCLRHVAQQEDKTNKNMLKWVQLLSTK